MAITTVSFVNSEGGTAVINAGASVGEDTRSVQVFAIPNDGYQFAGWEITVEEPSSISGGASTTSGTSGGTGGGLGGSGAFDVDFSI